MSRKLFNLTAIATSAILSCTAMQLAADVTFVQAGVGYRQDSITLNVKERGTFNPRAKSNRHFKDLEIITTGVKFKNTLGCCDAYVRASFDWGFVLDGKVREQLTATERSDVEQFCNAGYATEGRYERQIVHNSIKSNSYVWDIDVAFAYPILCGCDNFILAPAIGFSVDRQHLKVKKRANFHVDECFSKGRDKKCEKECKKEKHCPGASHRATWWGPWLGLDFVYNSPECWNVYGAFEFHCGRARRQISDSTGRSYFDNYRRTKCFYGPLFKLGTAYMFCENWYADAYISYQKYFSNNNRDKISWSSGQIRLDIGYVF